MTKLFHRVLKLLSTAVCILLLFACSSSKDTASAEFTPQSEFDESSYINPEEYGYNPIAEKEVNKDELANQSFEPATIKGGLVRAQRELKYPKRARKIGVKGQVTLALYIDSTGTLRNMSVLQTPHDLLTEAAKNAAKELSYNAAKLKGEPVNSFIFVPMRFRLRRF